MLTTRYRLFTPRFGCPGDPSCARIALWSRRMGLRRGPGARGPVNSEAVDSELVEPWTWSSWTRGPRYSRIHHYSRLFTIIHHKKNSPAAGLCPREQVCGFRFLELSMTVESRSVHLLLPHTCPSTLFTKTLQIRKIV